MPASTLLTNSITATSPEDVTSPGNTTQISPSTEATPTNDPVTPPGTPQVGPEQSCGPIQSMPVDVMLHIFHMGTHCDGDDGAQFPVLVSHVCRSWREAAVNTCTLWTKIFISSAGVARWTDFRVGPVLPQASGFVLRSRARLLDIKLHVMLPREGDIRIDIAHMYIRFFTSACMELIASVHKRVRSLDVITDVPDTTFLITHRLLPLGVPMLETCRMKSTADIFAPVPVQVDTHPRFAEFDASGERGGWLGTEDKRAPMEELLPRIQKLDLTGINATWSQWNIGGLTSLTLNHAGTERPDMSELHGILAKSSHSLARLEIMGSLPFAPVRETGRRLSLALPKLRDLRVGYHAQMEAVRFLLTLQLPSVKALALVDLARTAERRRRKAIANSASASGLPFAMGLPSLNYDYRFDSSYLVVSLYSLCPTLLAQIETLEMVNVWIALRPQIGSDALCLSISNQFIYPARFFMALSSLKTLLVYGADRCLLQSLNQVVPVRGHRGATKPSFTYPGAQLTRLRVLDSEYEDLLRFLYDRIEIARHLARHPEFSEKLPIFRQLEVSVLPKNIDPFQQECSTGKLRGLASSWHRHNGGVMD
ncbi:hypothetical protein F5I97DRAFT_1647657 [Phlebopus sp. FC_14]|nr:hypothetical protein F5I97DRAFT_1647657 [Phlebopus sp. FC_14]